MVDRRRGPGARAFLPAGPAVSRPVIGRDWQGRTRYPRTMEEAFGVRGGLHAGRPRVRIDLDWIVGVIVTGVVTALIVGVVLP